MLTTVLVALLGTITVVNGQCPNITDTPVTIKPNPISTCGAVNSGVYVNITIGGSLYNSSQPFMLNAGNNMKAITSNVSVNVDMMVPSGVGYLTVTCNNTEYGRANTTATSGTPSSISVQASVQSSSEATVTIGAIVPTPPDCVGHCSYYNVSYLPSDGSANDTAAYERGPGTMLTYTLQNLMALTTYNVTVRCSESANVYDSTQFTTRSSGISVNPLMLLMVLSTLIGILMTAQG